MKVKAPRGGNRADSTVKSIILSNSHYFVLSRGIEFLSQLTWYSLLSDSSVLFLREVGIKSSFPAGFIVI